MGASCYRVHNRNLFFVGGHCENSCFRSHGGCEASSEFEAVKTEVHCEIRYQDKMKMVSMEKISEAVKSATEKGKSIFLYTPDMFSDTYFSQCFQKLPRSNGDTYIAINAGVRTFFDRKVDWADILSKGIREIWIGVESASPILRNRYFKQKFTNDEVLKITADGMKAGVNICWYLVDGVEDKDETRLKTYQLIKKGSPFRAHIGQLQQYK